MHQVSLMTNRKGTKMTKQSLPKEQTYFLNFNRDSIKPMIDAIISTYEIPAEELEYLKTKAVKFESDRILFWRPEYSQFNYVAAHGRFLNYNYLSHGEPRVEVLRADSNELEFVYTDRINTEILREFDAVYGE